MLMKSANLNRRALLVGLGVVLVVPGLGCAGGTSLALKPWSEPAAGEKDVRLRALSYAVLAPNAHNTQPWSIALHGTDELSLYVDRSRLLPATDPPFRQAHVSQGTFLELLVIALGAFGYDAEVTLFPEGEYSNTELLDRPVARVRVAARTHAPDPLFSSIVGRRSNKQPYDPERRLEPARVAAIRASVAGGDATLTVIEAAASRARLARLCADAMAAEVKDRDRNVETAKWFRFSDSEVEAKRDGFGLAHSGVTGFRKWYAEAFLLDRESAADPAGSFASSAVDMACDQAESAPAFGVLATPENTRRAQVLAGRAYARVALTVESLGLAMHPMSQALEEYPDMAEVKARFEREVGLARGAVQMFFRLGHAPPSTHTPRRDVHAMLRST
jgi:hypothetical protein